MKFANVLINGIEVTAEIVEGFQAELEDEIIDKITTSLIKDIWASDYSNEEIEVTEQDYKNLATESEDRYFDNAPERHYIDIVGGIKEFNRLEQTIREVIDEFVEENTAEKFYPVNVEISCDITMYIKAKDFKEADRISDNLSMGQMLEYVMDSSEGIDVSWDVEDDPVREDDIWSSRNIIDE